MSPFCELVGRAITEKESVRQAENVSVYRSGVHRPAWRLKKSRKREFTLVGQRVTQQILGVVTSFPNPSQSAARLAKLIPTESNQPSEPTRPAVLFLERVLHSQVTSCSGLAAHL